MSTPSRILLPAAVDPRALSDYCSADHGMTHEAMVIAAAKVRHEVAMLRMQKHDEEHAYPS